jgi:hypothetical protein
LYITDIIQDTHLIKHQEKIKESTNPHSWALNYAEIFEG